MKHAGRQGSTMKLRLWVFLRHIRMFAVKPTCLFCFFRTVSSWRTCMMSPTHFPWALRWLHAWQLCVVVWDVSVHLYHWEYKSCLLVTSRRWRSLLLQVQSLHHCSDVTSPHSDAVRLSIFSQCCMFIWSQVWILSGRRVLFFPTWLMRVSWMPVQAIYWDIGKTSEQVM